MNNTLSFARTSSLLVVSLLATLGLYASVFSVSFH